jgi:hypothetical protein
LVYPDNKSEEDVIYEWKIIFHVQSLSLLLTLPVCKKKRKRFLEKNSIRMNLSHLLILLTVIPDTGCVH